MNWFNLSLRLNGFPISKARGVLKQIQGISPEHYPQHIEERRTEIVTHHLKNNAFYRSLNANTAYSNWGDLPVMTKRDLQVPIASRLSEGFKPKRVYINKTSGSSGDPFIFAKDKWCHALTWAVIMDRFSWYDIDVNRSSQARFYGIPLDKKGYYKERFKDWLGNRYRFSVFDLSQTAFERCLNKFSNTAFNYINGYTSAIVQFAKFLDSKGIILSSVCPSLKVCMVTSEMLFEDDKTLMERVFGIPIVNEYGASELDLIAFQHPDGRWLLNNETLYVEILDENDQPLPNGQEGRVVITSLFNKAHPFIRYDIGDIGIISEGHGPNNTVLEKLIGRTNDIAYLPSGKKAAGLTFYYITKSIIEDDGNVKEFIIIQLKKDLFKIQYTSDTELDSGEKEVIANEMINYLERGIRIEFERLSKLERSKSGKLKQFISKINQES
ncbi:MAG: phenylacetate--CoA ligase family protein [Flavobacteriaceae bacterium]|nr:phenylacetate--CoA ligase family protein [Bacteroidia bacterium]NNK87016.1 phenylacetate--CoA ligase family protein [Flavobacteriaceae bacterium]